MGGLVTNLILKEGISTEPQISHLGIACAVKNHIRKSCTIRVDIRGAKTAVVNQKQARIPGLDLPEQARRRGWFTIGMRIEQATVFTRVISKQILHTMQIHLQILN